MSWAAESGKEFGSPTRSLVCLNGEETSNPRLCGLLDLRFRPTLREARQTWQNRWRHLEKARCNLRNSQVDLRKL